MAAFVLVPAMGLCAQTVTVPTTGTWQEEAFGTGTVLSQIAASGPDWSLTADKLTSAVPAPAGSGWQWQTEYVNGVFDFMGLGGVTDTVTGLTLTNLNNNVNSIPVQFELSGAGTVLSGMGFSLLGTFDAAVSGDPTVTVKPASIVVSGTLTEASVTFTPVSIGIDIKPGSDPNSVNLKSRGVVPVAVFGSADLDVMDIDVDSLTLAGATAKPRGKSGAVASYTDVNGDGSLDMTLRFFTQGLDLSDDAVEASLAGKLGDGTLILGTDSVRLVPMGDANEDLSVDVFDLAAVANGYGKGGKWGDGDFNGDDVVNVHDLALLANSYGSAPAGAEPVPEPAALALLAMGAAGLLRRRRR